MDLLTLFNVTNIVVASISFILALLVFSVNFRYKGNPHAACCTIYPFALLLLGAHKVSTCYLVSEHGLEIFSTQSLTLLSACICVFAMAANAFLTHKHYRLFANWVLLLTPSVTFFLVNQLMMHYHYYRPIYSFEEIEAFRTSTPIFFFARLFCLAMMSLSVFSALFLVGDALAYDIWRLSNRPTSDNTFSHKIAAQITLIWTVLLLFGYVPLCLDCLWMHLLFNLFYFIALVLSVYVCKAGMKEMQTLRAGQNPSTLIGQRLPQLLEMEEGGSTAWGAEVKPNPFFSGNPLLEDVARALGVTSIDVQRFVATHDTNLVAWVSEQRLLHCAQQVAETDRKIVEIAISCGYNDLPSFTRAFRRQFGTSPSEYRKGARKG